MNTSLRCLALVSLFVLTTACGDKGSGSPDDGSDGETGSGGSGGSDTSAASSNSGGTNDTGGTGGTGGDTATSAGSAGSAGGPVEAELQYDFEDGLDAWAYNYSSSAEGVELIDASDVDVTWNEEDGNPGGALQATIQYESAGQYVGIGIDLTNSPLDLTGRVITAEIMLVEGVGDVEDLMTNPAGAKLYAKAGDDYVYNAGYFRDVTVQGEWITISYDLTDPGYEDPSSGTFDPSDIREVGVQFDTSGTSTSAQPGTWLLDNISW